MSTTVTLILALLAAAPQAYAQIVALWNGLKSGASATDVAAIDAILATLNPKTDADLAKLQADANAASA